MEKTEQKGRGEMKPQNGVRGPFLGVRLLEVLVPLSIDTIFSSLGLDGFSDYFLTITYLFHCMSLIVVRLVYRVFLFHFKLFKTSYSETLYCHIFKTYTFPSFLGSARESSIGDYILIIIMYFIFTYRFTNFRGWGTF